MSSPRLSIVTPCLNRAATIGAAIDSVLEQRHPSFEHIIIDGGSTDGTAEVLARYPHLTVIREKDRNLYDAINKGLRAVRGDLTVVSSIRAAEVDRGRLSSEGAQMLVDLLELCGEDYTDARDAIPDMD